MSVPALRFPEFEGELTHQFLGNLAKSPISYGVVQPGYDNSEGVPFVRGGDFPDGELDIATLRRIPESISNQFKRTKLRGGELLVSLVGYPGSCTIVSSDLFGANVARQVAVVRLSTSLSSKYTFQYLRSDIGQKKLQRKVVGSAQQVINLIDLRKISLIFPSLPEQKKIAAFLAVVDAKIAALRDRVAGLERYKRGLMQALFSQTLRFTKPDGSAFPDWEEKRLGEIATVKTGSRDTQDRTSTGKYPFFVRSDTIERIDSFAFDGEAILTSGDGVGVGKNFHYVNEKFDYHQRVYAIYHFCDAVIGRYIYEYFSSHFLKRVMRLSAKNSVDSVRMSMITDMLVPIPHLDEQAKIAGALQAMDAKITAVTDQLARMQDFKKGLLRQMFV